VIETYQSLRAMLAAEITTAEALEQGIIGIHGERHLLDRFVDLFHIPPTPARVEGLAVR
jgi:hypothetical protein